MTIQLNLMYQRVIPIFVYLTLLIIAVPTSSFSQHWTYATLTEGKRDMMTAVIGTKIYFYSGAKITGSYVERVNQLEIFDVRTNNKVVSTLPAGAERYYGATAVSGSNVFFGGGDSNGGITSRVDIYDTLTGSWSTSYLSLDRSLLAAAAGNGKVLFGGGRSFSLNKVTNVMDVYNTNTSTWTSTFFPFFGSSRLTAVAIGNKVLFAGGQTSGSTCRNEVYMYNTQTSQWLTTQYLSQPKHELSSQVYKNKVYFIGGTVGDPATNKLYPSENIDVYNNVSGAWSTINIPHLIIQNPENSTKCSYTKSAIAGCKLFLLPNQLPFGIPDSIAVYDLARDTWSYLSLPHPRRNTTIAASGNKIYFAGGQSYTSGTNTYSSDVDILTLEPKLQLTVNNTPLQTYDVGTISPGDQSNTTIELSNQGDCNLLFKESEHRISLTGDVDDFTIDVSTLMLTDTLEPAQIISLPVIFHPVNIGTKHLTIIIESNDPQTPAYSFHLTGVADDIATSVISPGITPLTVYPNPTSGMFHINAGQCILEVQVQNLQGIVLIDQHLADHHTDFDISSLPEGLYILKMKGVTSTSTLKIIKK